MIPPSATRVSLLVRIRDPHDRVAWGDFVQVYSPLIYSYGVHRGLQDADAADLVQDVLRQVVRSAPEFRYQPDKGSFRGWLLAVTRNELRRLVGRKGRAGAGSGDSAVNHVLDQLPDAAGDDEHWEREYRWAVFQGAADRVRPEFHQPTWQAFWQTAVAGRDAADVAAELNLSTGAVYVARSRVTARLRDAVREIEGE